jgi:hypothetical protein
MEQSVPKRRHIKFRRRGITQKKEYNIQNTAKVWNQEPFKKLTIFSRPFAWSKKRRPLFCPLLCLHVSTRFPKRIPIELYIGDFHKKFVEKIKNLVKIGQSTAHITRRSKCVLLMPATLNCHKNALFEWNGIRLLGQSRSYVPYVHLSQRYVALTFSSLFRDVLAQRVFGATLWPIHEGNAIINPN